MVLKDHVKTYDCYIFTYTTTVPIATKLDKLLACRDLPLPIMLLRRLITWSCKITQQTKTIISSLPQYLWPQNQVGL